MKVSHYIRGVAVLVLGIPLASCDDSPSPFSSSVTPSLSHSSQLALIECPSNKTISTVARIGTLGGVIELEGHKLSIPPKAVLAPTEFRFIVPASKYVEVEIQGGGLEHFDFLLPVELTLSYERCTREDILKRTMHVQYIDEDTKNILENLGGIDNKTEKKVRTRTGHLSGYAIGAGRSDETSGN